MVEHTFDPSRQVSEFEASLAYKTSSRTAKAVKQKIPLKKKKSVRYCYGLDVR